MDKGACDTLRKIRGVVWSSRSQCDYGEFGSPIGKPDGADGAKVSSTIHPLSLTDTQPLAATIFRPLHALETGSLSVSLIQHKNPSTASTLVGMNSTIVIWSVSTSIAFYKVGLGLDRLLARQHDEHGKLKCITRKLARQTVKLRLLNDCKTAMPSHPAHTF